MDTEGVSEALLRGEKESVAERQEVAVMQGLEEEEALGGRDAVSKALRVGEALVLSVAEG